MSLDDDPAFQKLWGKATAEFHEKVSAERVERETKAAKAQAELAQIQRARHVAGAAVCRRGPLRHREFTHCRRRICPCR